MGHYAKIRRRLTKPKHLSVRPRKGGRLLDYQLIKSHQWGFMLEKNIFESII